MTRFGGFLMVCACMLALGASGASAAAKKPDLVVRSASGVPASVAPGGSFAITDTVANSGRGVAKASSNGYLLSLDGIQTADDTVLATRAIKKLKARKSSKGTVTLRVPAATPPALYVVLVCADQRRKVKEAKENNNCRPAGRLSVAAPLISPIVPVVTPAPTVTATATATATPAPPDTTAPGAPSITASTPAPPSADPTPDLAGTAEPGATIRLYAGADCTSSILATTTASAGGGFTFAAVSVPANASTTFRATAADAASNVSSCSQGFVYVHDDIAPAAPAVTGTSPASPATDATPDVAGTAAPGSTVRLFSSSDCTGAALATATASAGGAVVWAAVSVTPEVATTFKATATEAAGNTSACSAGLTYVHDDTDPAAPSLTSTSPASPGRDRSPDLAGTAEPGASVALFKSTTCTGGAVATATATGAGAVSFAAVDVALDEPTTFTARTTDAAGNASPCSATLVYTHDETAPAAPAITGFTPASPADSLTPKAIGTAETGGTVRLFGTADCTGTALGSGSAAEFNAPGIEVPVGADTVNDLRAKVTDAAGNASACSAPRTYTHCSIPCEIEPNNRVEDATPLTTLRRGSLPAGDSDYFTFTVPERSRATVETVAGDGGPCPNGGARDTKLTLSTFEGILDINDDKVAGDLCSKIVRSLDAGTYIAIVEGFQEGAVPDYRVVLTFAPEAIITATDPASPSDDPTPSVKGLAPAGSTVFVHATADCSDQPLASGSEALFEGAGIEIAVAPQTTNRLHVRSTGPVTPCAGPFTYVRTTTLQEVEPNDTPAQATGPITASTAAAGQIDPAADVDHYRIDVPAHSRVELETFDSTQQACADGTDTDLQLLAQDQTTQIATDANGGLGLCSLINRVLAPGTYYVRVAEQSGAATIAAYRLAVRMTRVAVITASDPVSPGTSTTPKLIGSATPGSTVAVHTNAACTGTPAATGSAAQFASPGLTVTVAPRSTTAFYVRQVDQPAECAGPLTYVQAVTLSESEPNDTAATADGPITSSTSFAAAINPVADKDFVNFTITGPTRVELETFDSSQADCPTGFDTELRLLDTNQANPVYDDDSGLGSCSKIVRDLSAPGTYYAQVNEFGNNAVIGAYRLAVRLTPSATITASNPASPNPSTTPKLIGTASPGTVNIYTSSDCSGTPVATGTAAEFASPGLAVSVPAGTTRSFFAKAGDDGFCSARLLYGALTASPELEPNDDVASADSAAAGGVIIRSNARWSGSLASPADSDLFKLEVAQEGVLRLEAFDASMTSCGSAGPDVILLDSTATARYTDQTSGIGGCGALVVPVTPGTYYVRVDDAAAIAAYVLEANFQAANGAESEPNDSVATADPFGPLDGAVAGEITGTQIDYFSFTLAHSGSARIETAEAAGGATCESNLVDTGIELLAPDGTTVLVNDDDDGRGRCSRIDGTGSVPQDAGAANLAPGTYYVRVRRVADPAFTYRLQITVR